MHFLHHRGSICVNPSVITSATDLAFNVIAFGYPITLRFIGQLLIGLAMPPLSACFVLRGRITRSEWFSRLTMAALVCAAFGSLTSEWFSATGPDLCALVFIWVAIALAVQRLHDVGRPGGALYIAIVPVIGPLWVAVQLLKRGVDHSNAYGDEPARRADYLQVNISK